MAILLNSYRHAVVGGSGHRYWRVLINEAASSGAPEIAEIEMRATVGGADQCTAGTAFASTVGGANVASRAFDDSTATQWAASSGSVPQHIGYDFGTNVNVAELYMYPSSNTDAPTDFEFQWSDDGSIYTTVYKSIDNGGQDWTPGVARTWLVNCAMSLKLVWTANNGGSSTRIREIEYRAAAAGADQTTTSATGPSGIGSNASNHAHAALVFDNDINTLWDPGTATLGTIRFDFPTAFTLYEYMIHIGATTSQSPRDWTLQESLDGGVNWSTLDTIVANTFTTNQQKVFVI